MGKRKERRLAALSNAGRRVKLDLFAEPSGDLGGSSVHDDVGDSDSKNRDGLPNSPSSSGQQSQNPLLLLGQYSDEEVDDGSSRRDSDAKDQSSLLNEDAKASPEEGSQDLDINVSEDHVAQTDGPQGTSPNSTSDAEGCDKVEGDAVGDCLEKEVVSKDHTPVSEIFNEQVISDVSLGWKMVMHEESKRYYYWNVETGETSWEVPHGLAQTAELVCDQTTSASVNNNFQSSAAGVNNSEIYAAAVHESLAALATDGSLRKSVISNGGAYSHGSQTNGWDKEYRNDGLSRATFGSEDLFVSKPCVEEQVVTNIPYRLVQHSESLLERLKSLEKSMGNLQVQDSLSKYILEIEIRLSDFRSLASHGQSLLPFWEHSDKRIKQLESVINDDLLPTFKAAQDEVEDTHVHDSEGLGEHQKGIEHEVEGDGTENKDFVTSEFSDSPQVDSSVLGVEDTGSEPPVNDEHVPSALSAHMDIGDNKKDDAMVPPEELARTLGPSVGDDVDMDVDMEVEDMSSSGNTTVAAMPVMNGFVLIEQSVPEDEFVVPPPPDDEWMPPPPPPDDQHIPPLPPDEPSVPSYPVLPSYPEAGQSISYPQYNLAYPGASCEYYVHAAAEVPGSTIYGHAEGSQIAMPPAQLYYSAVPVTYGESPQVIVNSAEPVAYYDLQNGTVPRSLPLINDNVSDVTGGADMASGEVPSTSASIKEPSTVPVNDGVSLALTNTVSAASNTASSSVAKVQNRVGRSKKRTVAVGSSLKSNKKVSSLVDKWKAAKEELLEEEEEPESVFDIFERKRQREIEEWHAKQIASGEAKDNANFQPLGGDWRERVKRKRAKVASESVDSTLDTVEGNKQPDLSELSKDLPSGWQAYWDETSKQVYYGNTITAETTWTRPTK